MKSMRWGILGASKFAREHMGPALHAAKGSELVALGTSNSEKAKDFWSFAPEMIAYRSYDALLGDTTIGAVYIPLPNNLHVPWALKALAAGKHVLVEKPAALSVEELDTLIAARDASGLILAEAFMILHHPQWLKMRSLVQEGTLGALRRVSTAFSYDNRNDPNNIRNQSAHGGGSLRDIGVYTFGCVRFATGLEPRRIVSKQLTMEAGVDVHAHVTAEFDGFIYDSTTSMRMSRWQFAEFHFEKAVARLSAPFNPRVFGEARLEVFHSDGSVKTYRWPRENQYVLQIEAFQRSVDGAPFIGPLEFSRGTQAMIDDVLGR